jgi:DNA-binding PadR family transcriptional regulator
LHPIYRVDITDDVIELAILGVLKESELHGYELKKRLREVLGPLSSVSFGSLYPALNRLEAAGAVKAVEAGTAPATTIPMTGSFTGEAAAFRAARRTATRRGPRGKKVYGITEAGDARLCELIADPTDDDRAFNVKLAFCRFCDAETRLALLQRRRDALAAQLVERGGPTKVADRYLKALFEHDQESIERDIAWLDRLIDTEETS